jgi:hypothetical protein
MSHPTLKLAFRPCPICHTGKPVWCFEITTKLGNRQHNCAYHALINLRHTPPSPTPVKANP